MCVCVCVCMDNGHQYIRLLCILVYSICVGDKVSLFIYVCVCVCVCVCGWHTIYSPFLLARPGRFLRVQPKAFCGHDALLRCINLFKKGNLYTLRLNHTAFFYLSEFFLAAKEIPGITHAILGLKFNLKCIIF